MDWLVFLEDWGRTSEGIAATAAIIVSSIGSLMALITKAINEYRRHTHDCPVSCGKKKPLKPRKKNVNAKPKK